MVKFILFTLSGLFVAAVLAVIALAIPIFDKFGPWLSMPDGEAPRSQQLDNPAYAALGDEALALLLARREELAVAGITAAVAIDGQLVWSGAVGWADIATGRAMARDTVLRIGSTSKAVTATALARLIDAGAMTLDTPISAYISDLPNPAWAALTPRQLASHTAGMPHYQTNGDLTGSYFTMCGCVHYDTVRDSLDVFDGSSLLFEPGTDFSYSSFDVTLLGAAMAERAGVGYLDLLEREVAAPLGLQALGGDHDGVERPELASFYDRQNPENGPAQQWRNHDAIDLSQRWPSGGLVSTSVDLVRIGSAWLDPAYISAATRTAMWTPQTLSDGEVNEQFYALGWRFYAQSESPGDPTRLVDIAHHGGVSEGATSSLVVYPQSGLVIAVNMNGNVDDYSDFSAVSRGLAALFLPPEQ